MDRRPVGGGGGAPRRSARAAGVHRLQVPGPRRVLDRGVLRATLTDSGGRALAEDRRGDEGEWCQASAASGSDDLSGHRSGHTGGVQFSAELRDRVADGSITVSYRLWSRRQVKVGGRYSVAGVTIVVDDVELVPLSSVTDEDLAQTGEADLESLRRRAAHAGPIDDDTLLHRIEFHVE
ncbi:ASCH domain-containing protein [Actinomarinicola tropica]|uniref:ASCH domain-containing protein n=1 Tax=Actinomarinicola tropica TaxID=2789776 RepID=A0A5Q2RRC5_9ACTN|nr:ASCH domain-containing protein [Actinomarinicola tropica]